MKNKKIILLVIILVTLFHFGYAQDNVQAKTETKTESNADRKARERALRIVNRKTQISKPNPITRDKARSPYRSHNADRPGRLR